MRTRRQQPALSAQSLVRTRSAGHATFQVAKTITSVGSVGLNGFGPSSNSFWTICKSPLIPKRESLLAPCGGSFVVASAVAPNLKIQCLWNSAQFIGCKPRACFRSKDSHFRWKLRVKSLILNVKRAVPSGPAQVDPSESRLLSEGLRASTSSSKRHVCCGNS